MNATGTPLEALAAAHLQEVHDMPVQVLAPLEVPDAITAPLLRVRQVSAEHDHGIGTVSGLLKVVAYLPEGEALDLDHRTVRARGRGGHAFIPMTLAEGELRDASMDPVAEPIPLRHGITAHEYALKVVSAVIAAPELAAVAPIGNSLEIALTPSGSPPLTNLSRKEHVRDGLREVTITATATLADQPGSRNGALRRPGATAGDQRLTLERHLRNLRWQLLPRVGRVNEATLNGKQVTVTVLSTPTQ